MNARLIWLLSLAGIVVGLSTVLGLIHTGIEFVLWVVLGIAYGAILGNAAPQRPFPHGFLTGFIAGMLSALTQVIFFENYLTANPEAALSFGQLPEGMYPQVLILILAPLVSGLNGLFVGLLAWLAAKVLARNRPGGAGARPAA